MLEGKKRLLAAWLATAFLYCWGLDRAGFADPDEPRYASIGREMAASGNWITPQLWGKPWFEKPAFLYWLSGAGYSMGLGSETAARLPVALVSLGFLAGWFLLARAEWGARAAATGALLLASSVGWMAYSQLGLTDLPMAAFFNLALLLFIRWRRMGELRAVIAGGGVAGLAVLSKGLVPLVLLAPCALIFWRRWTGMALATMACLAVAVPWYAACYAQNGFPFLQEFFWKHHFERFSSDTLQHQQPFWFYVPVLLTALLPWTGLLSLIRIDWKDGCQRLLAITAVFGFAFFSLSRNKLPGYLLPLLPVICLLMALQAAERIPVWATVLTAMFVGILPFVLQLLTGALETGITHAQPDWVLLLIMVPAGFIGLLLARRTQWVLPAGALATGVGLFCFKLWLAPVVDARLSARRSWERTGLEERGCVNDGPRAWRYSLFFYAGKELRDCRPGEKGVRRISR